MRVIAVDIDSTIWDSYPLYKESCERIFNKSFTREDMSHWLFLKDLCGEGYWGVFDDALHPSKIPQREIYEGCVETIEYLKDKGFKIHFVTHNKNPDLMRKPLKKWLKSLFGDVGLSITKTGSKLPIFRKIGAEFVIEDRLETVEEAVENGIKCFLIEQPWNVSGRSNVAIRYFKQWQGLRYFL